MHILEMVCKRDEVIDRVCDGWFGYLDEFG